MSALDARLGWVDSTAILTIGGEVDVASAPQLQARIEDALGHEPVLLVVELSGVSFFGSAGLSVLLLASAAAGKCGLRVVASPPVRRPIEVTGLDRVLEVFETLQDALTSGENPISLRP